MERLKAFYRRHEKVFIVVAVAFAGSVPYALLNQFTHGRAATTLGTSLDERIPFVKDWEYVYAWYLLFTLLPVTVIKETRLLARAALSYLALYAICNTTFLLFPTRIVRYVDPTGQDFLDWGIRLNHWMDGPYNCFPSLHVATAVLASLIVLQLDRVVGAVAMVVALLIAISTLTLKAHYLADVVVGMLVAGALWWTIFRPHARGEPERRPRWVTALLPIGFVLVISGLYVGMYQRGVEVPSWKWEKPGEVYTWNPSTGRFDPPAAALAEEYP